MQARCTALADPASRTCGRDDGVELPLKRVSPSIIARYYFHEVRNFLRYVATNWVSAGRAIPSLYDTRSRGGPSPI